MTNEQFDTHLWKKGQRVITKRKVIHEIISIDFDLRIIGYKSKRNISGIRWFFCSEVELIND
jgi:hypothetical protein